MRRRQKKQQGEKPARFPGEPKLDSVDWAQKILYGDEGSRLKAIFEAKGRRDAEALPVLIRQMVSSDEPGLEAREAIPVIIEANPGNEDVISMGPVLAGYFDTSMAGYWAVWVCARILETNPKKLKELAPKLMEVGEQAVKESDGYLLEEIAICLGQMGAVEAVPMLRRGLETMSLDEEVRDALERIARDLGRQAYMH
ncbi:MAG: hypothetical protein AB1324_04725 [Candidatus Micrarchaeota archaeon]